ncbi:transposase [Paraburkholderia sp.]|uniref:transposase n=1 Tax=Paraburkholderia sp. TaxID=1926495 RepID=UPI0023A6B463|nr:transposase [Paraburkholderia sp.]MDE1184329.1 transposase [Paraburkholderia sp.]
MFFDELSNDEWAIVSTLVSDEPAIRLNRRGRPRAEPRVVANAVLWILTTGEPWSKLPGRYPSGPTCRRRFEEWQQNGTLLHMVRLLEQTGRTFAYIPEAAPPVAAKPAVPAAAPVAPARDEGLGGVSWKRPESWQTPGASNAAPRWRAPDPMADIARQLGALDPVIVDAVTEVRAETPVAVAMSHAEAANASAMLRPVRAPYGASVPAASVAGGYAPYQPQGVHASTSYASCPAQAGYGLMREADRRRPLSMSLSPRGTPIADRRGYAIYIAAEAVPNTMYRAWAEIVKDGKRVERSGLVGPRFADADAATQFALEWARQWIDRHERSHGQAQGQTNAHALRDTPAQGSGFSRQQAPLRAPQELAVRNPVAASGGPGAHAGKAAHGAQHPLTGQVAHHAMSQHVGQSAAHSANQPMTHSVNAAPHGVAVQTPYTGTTSYPNAHPASVASHPASYVSAQAGSPNAAVPQFNAHAIAHATHVNAHVSGQPSGSMSALRMPLRRYPEEPSTEASSERFPLSHEFISHAG